MAKDAILEKARQVRQSLLRRERNHPAIAGTSPTAEEIYQWLLDQEPLVCVYSGQPIYKLRDLHVDHKTPVARGGTNSLDNLCVATAQMNTAKGNMTDIEFVALIDLTSAWEDQGAALFRRLRQGRFG